MLTAHIHTLERRESDTGEGKNSVWWKSNEFSILKAEVDGLQNISKLPNVSQDTHFLGLKKQ